MAQSIPKPEAELWLIELWTTEPVPNQVPTSKLSPLQSDLWNYLDDLNPLRAFHALASLLALCCSLAPPPHSPLGTGIPWLHFRPPGL